MKLVLENMGGYFLVDLEPAKFVVPSCYSGLVAIENMDFSNVPLVTVGVSSYLFDNSGKVRATIRQLAKHFSQKGILFEVCAGRTNERLDGINLRQPKFGMDYIAEGLSKFTIEGTLVDVLKVLNKDEQVALAVGEKDTTLSAAKAPHSVILLPGSNAMGSYDVPKEGRKYNIFVTRCV